MCAISQAWGEGFAILSPLVEDCNNYFAILEARKLGELAQAVQLPFLNISVKHKQHMIN